MQSHEVVTPEEWLAARAELLKKEKLFTRMRDQLSEQRRLLPWVKVEKEYIFDGPDGRESLSDLFAGRGQLIVYHFMFDPKWELPCKSCSFWADNFNGIVPHLNHRDATMLAVSRAPLEKLRAFRERMGWSFKWVSSGATDFNFDYHVSFTPEEIQSGEVYYNYGKTKPFSSEAPGISVFRKDGGGNVFHTYSAFSRGIDMLNVAYHYLDLLPKGRDEAGLKGPQAWVRFHDRYED